VSIVPPMAVLSDAIYHALEVRLNRLTMSSGRVVETLRAKEHRSITAAREAR
jgi:hypothetical protein